MRFFSHKLALVLMGASACTLATGCPVSVDQAELSQTLLTFSEDLLREILAAFLL
jgi:hypothetical protein